MNYAANRAADSSALKRAGGFSVAKKSAKPIAIFRSFGDATTILRSFSDATATCNLHEQDDAPRRPSIPPILVCALGMWGTAAVTYTLSEHASATASIACAAAASVFALVAAVFLMRRSQSRAFFGSIVLGVTLGFVCGCAGAAALHISMEQAALSPYASWRFEALEDASAGSYGAQCLMRATRDDGMSVLVRATLAASVGTPLYGDAFTASATLSPPTGTSATYCWQQGAAATARIASMQPVEQEGLRGALLHLRARAIDLLASSSAGGDAGAVLQALVCGARGELSESPCYADFKAAGLAHMVAVSGAHLVIVSSFLALVLRTLHAPRMLTIALQTLFMLAYLAFAAAPISAVRAAIMALTGMSSYAARRRPAPLNAVGICVMVLLATSPATAVSVSFALSAGSTIGILLLSGLFASWLDAGRVRLPRFMRDAFALTFASSIVTVPASAALFAQASLVSPLANAAAAPFFVLACTGGLVSVVVALAIPVTAPLAIGAAGALAHLLVIVVHTAASVPFASIPVSAPVVPAIVLSVVMTLALWRIWPHLRACTLVAAISVVLVAFALWVVLSPRLAGTEIVMLDVGQGDAFLVRSEGACMLIDTGNHDRDLREALARHGVWQLDAVLVTHGDSDHCGSLESLRGVARVQQVCLAQDDLTCSCESCADLRQAAITLVKTDAVCGLSVGDTLWCGAVSLHVVWPREFTDGGGNADSVCLLAKADVNHDGATDWTALFCGDAEAAQLEELIRSGVVGRVDLYKVGHHGSRAALDDATAAALSPAIALVSVGANNRYGHPADETLARLTAVGARVLRTDEQGDVSCRLEADAICVTTLR